MNRLRVLLTFVLVTVLGCGGTVAVVPTPEAHTGLEQTGVLQTLLDLLERRDRIKPYTNDEEFFKTSLPQIYSFKTPAGYRIYLRYRNFGIAVVEALRSARDPELKRRLIELAQWSRTPEVRADAILTLAGLSNPAHKKYFKEAVLDSKVAIRFAAIEALQKWNQPESLQLIHLASDRDWSPMMKIFAANVLLSMGDESGLPVLWTGLEHRSWVVRAMSARYLGDFANPTDYQTLVSHLNREQENDFVAAEMAIAALKLISKKGEKVYYSPATKGWADNQEVKYQVGKDGVVELEPLVIVPPRLRIPPSLQVAHQINNRMMDILRNRLSAKLDPVQEQDPIRQELSLLRTPTGFALYLRYTELSYLLVEALAGSTDLQIQSELSNVAETHRNDVVRATALVALAYNRNPRDIFLIQDALKSKSAAVRMGALEAVEVGKFTQILPTLAYTVAEDPCPAIQIYAIAVLAKFGDAGARLTLINRINDQDWPARAMAYWYLGRVGEPADYTLVLSRIGSEQNDFVKAEIALAAFRLAPL